MLRISGVISIPHSMPMVCLIDYVMCADVGLFGKIEIKQDRLSPTETVGEALEKKITQQHKSQERNCASQSIKHACLINNKIKGKRIWKTK
jgi:hypothetical protein